jgi:hypothetical protein
MSGILYQYLEWVLHSILWVARYQPSNFTCGNLDTQLDFIDKFVSALGLSAGNAYFIILQIYRWAQLQYEQIVRQNCS